MLSEALLLLFKAGNDGARGYRKDSRLTGIMIDRFSIRGLLVVERNSGFFTLYLIYIEDSYVYWSFFFFFTLYIIVLVLPNSKMNPPQVYMCTGL